MRWRDSRRDRSCWRRVRGSRRRRGRGRGLRGLPTGLVQIGRGGGGRGIACALRVGPEGLVRWRERVRYRYQLLA
jgi:hypothetical protein